MIPYDVMVAFESAILAELVQINHGVKVSNLDSRLARFERLAMGLYGDSESIGDDSQPDPLLAYKITRFKLAHTDNVSTERLLEFNLDYSSNAQ